MRGFSLVGLLHVASQLALTLASPISMSEALKLWERNEANCQRVVDALKQSNPDLGKLGHEVWYDQHVGVTLDEYIMAHGVQNWLTNLSAQLMKDNARGAGVYCDDVYGSTCDNPESELLGCAYYDKNGGTNLFWILQSAYLHYNYVKNFHDWFKDTIGNETAQDIDRLQELFQAPELPKRGDVKDFLGVLSSGLGLASELAGYSTSPTGEVMSSAISIVDTIIGYVRDWLESTEEEPIPAQDLLKDQFNILCDSMSTKLENLVYQVSHGYNKEDQAERKDVTPMLPGQSGSWQTNIAKYFDGGKYLNPDVSGTLQPFKDRTKQVLRQIAVQTLLIDQGFFVYWNVGWTTKEACENDHSWWLEEKCLDVWRWDTQNLDESYAQGWHMDVLSNMMPMDNGGFDVARMMLNALECATLHPDGSGTPDTQIPAPGEIPTCFYNWPVFKGFGRWAGNAWELCTDTVGSGRINTSGHADCGKLDNYAD